LLYVPPVLTFRNSTLYPQSIYILHVSKQNGEFFHKSYSMIGFYLTDVVYCAVRPESLNTTDSVISLKV